MRKMLAAAALATVFGLAACSNDAGVVEENFDPIMPAASTADSEDITPVNPVIPEGRTYTAEDMPGGQMTILCDDIGQIKDDGTFDTVKHTIPKQPRGSMWPKVTEGEVRYLDAEAKEAVLETDGNLLCYPTAG